MATDEDDVVLIAVWRNNLANASDVDLAMNYKNRTSLDAEFVRMLLAEMSRRGISPDLVEQVFGSGTTPSFSEHKKSYGFAYTIWLRGILFLLILFEIIGVNRYLDGESLAMYVVFYLVLAVSAVPAGFIAYLIECFVREIGGAAVDAFLDKQYLEAILLLIFILLVLW